MRNPAWQLVLVACAWLTIDHHWLRADGGRVCWSGTSSAYRLTVFAEPVPLRQGVIDLSLFVQDSRKLTPVSGAKAIFALIPPDSTTPLLEAEATRENATSPLFEAAQFNVPVTGRWQVKLVVSEPDGSFFSTLFPLQIAPPQPRVWSMAFWIALPVVPISWFVLRQLIHSRRVRHF
jgi:hypothetical protein